jgi:hypothetical protein
MAGRTRSPRCLARRRARHPERGNAASGAGWRTYHDTGVLRATHDGREHRAGRVVTGKAGLAHAGAIVHHQRLYLLLGLRGRGERGRGAGQQNAGNCKQGGRAGADTMTTAPHKYAAAARHAMRKAATTTRARAQHEAARRLATPHGAPRTAPCARYAAAWRRLGHGNGHFVGANSCAARRAYRHAWLHAYAGWLAHQPASRRAERHRAALRPGTLSVRTPAASLRASCGRARQLLGPCSTKRPVGAADPAQIAQALTILFVEARFSGKNERRRVLPRRAQACSGQERRTATSRAIAFLPSWTGPQCQGRGVWSGRPLTVFWIMSCRFVTRYRYVCRDERSRNLLFPVAPALLTHSAKAAAHCASPQQTRPDCEHRPAPRAMTRPSCARWR